GYEYILVDARLLLPGSGACSPRKTYDRKPRRDEELYQACAVENGHGLIALPIASHLRLNIPPSDESRFNDLRQHCRWLTTLADSPHDSFIAVYGDDMEKAAGVGAWDKNAPEQFERVLRWISETPSIRPFRICDWAAITRRAAARSIDVCTV